MNIIVLLFMNLIVLAGSFIITYKLFRIYNFIDSLICCFIFYLAQIISTELILGTIGILDLKNVILLNLAILLIIGLITKATPYSFNFNLKDTILALLKNKIILLGISVILSFGLVKVFINLINPPFGWDNLNYHFTFPVEWLKHGNLENPIVISDDPSPTYYPVNGSLFFLWLILPFKNVFLADLGQVPFFILAFLAAYSLSRKLGLNREYSFYAASVFFIIPNFFKQLQISYVDVMVAALFLTCLNYLFLLNREFSSKNVVAYSMSLGLLIGTKTVALPYSILLFLPFLYLCFKKFSKIHFLITSVFIIIALGGFSYIRNLAQTGNPLYPLDLKLFGWHIFKGVMDNGVYGAHFNIEDYRLSKLLFHEGLGLQTMIFILPSVFLALPVVLIKEKKDLNLNLIYFSILPILVYLVYRHIIPLANVRYLYSLLAVGIILSFYIITALGIPKPVIEILVTVCILSSLAELAKRQELATSMILTSALFFFSVLFINYKLKISVKKSLFIPLCLTLIVLLAAIEKDYIKNEYPRYIKMVKYSGFWPDAVRAWDWLNNNTQGNNIAYAGRPAPFPLYGTNFKNNVYYVSVNRTEPAKLHYFPESRYLWDDDFLSLHRNLERQGNYRSEADYSVWLNNLIKRNTDYLFVYSLHQTKDIEFPMEDAWAKADPGKFDLVFANGTMHIYKIKSSA